MAGTADWLAALAQSNRLAAPTGQLPNDDEAAQTMMWLGAKAPTLPVVAAPAPAPTGRFPVDVATTALMAPAPATKKQTARLDTPIVDRTKPQAAPLSFPLGGVGSAMILSPSVGASVARTKAAPAKSSIPDKIAPSKRNPNNQQSPVSTAEAVRAAIAPVREPTAQDRVLAAVNAVLSSPKGFTMPQLAGAVEALKGATASTPRPRTAKDQVIGNAYAMSQQQFANQVAQAQELAKTDEAGAREVVKQATDNHLQFLLSLTGANPMNQALAQQLGIDPDAIP